MSESTTSVEIPDVPMTPDDVKGQPVSVLRQWLRHRVPRAKGSFSVSANRDDCLRILFDPTDLTITATMADWAERQLAATHGAVAPSQVATAGPGAAAVHPADPFGAMRELLKVTNRPELTSVIDNAEKLAAEAAERPVFKPPVFAADRKSVEILGVAMPVLSEGQPDTWAGWADIPAKLEPYWFDAVRCKMELGTAELRHDAAPILEAIRDGSVVLLVGPPGVGKTVFVAQMAAACGWPYTRVNGHRDLSLMDFVGCYEARNGESIWMDGLLTRAMIEGHIFLWDEPFKCSADLGAVMHSVMEPGGKLVITACGKVVKPHENFRIVLADNCLGFGDATGRHVTSQVQDSALLDRVNLTFHIDYMEPKRESALLVEATGITKDTAGKMVNLANDTRSLAKDEVNGISTPIGWRHLATAAKYLVKGWQPQVVWANAVLAALPDCDVHPVAEIIQRYFPEAIPSDFTKK